MTDKHAAALGWALQHEPTRRAYRLSTGEDVAPIIDRYLAWLCENLIGSEDLIDVDEDAAA